MTPLVEVVIACHDDTRPLERAVASVMQDVEVRHLVRVTVVAHGLPKDRLSRKLDGIDGEWRVVEFADGIRSPAGPFNHGLDLSQGEYTAIMGSDDFLAPGAMASWVAHVLQHKPRALVARIRIDGFPRMPNPLTRLGRTRRLDAARDRLFYRTAPLGLIHTGTMRRLELHMTEGVRVGEDLEFGVRLWTSGERVDVVDGPEYVIGTDALERTTLAPMTVFELTESVHRLLDGHWLERMDPAHRASLTIKLIRITVVGHTRARSAAAQWHSDSEVREMAALLGRLLAINPRALRPFSIQDRDLLDVLLAIPTVQAVSRAATQASKAGRLRRWFTRNPLYAFDRESSLRRYVLYWIRSRRFRVGA